MNKIFNLSLCLLFSVFFLSQNAFAQLKIERKIIIQDGQFYFFTVDEETQLATLYSGSVHQKLKVAKKPLQPVWKPCG